MSFGMWENKNVMSTELEEDFAYLKNTSSSRIVKSSLPQLIIT